MRRRLAIVVVAAVCAPTSAPAQDDEIAAIRRDVDALVRRIEDGPKIDADSPTAIVNRLLSAGEAKLRQVLEEAWRIAAGRAAFGDDRETSVGWVVRFLYGRFERLDYDKDAPPIVCADGVVMIRPNDIGLGFRSGPWPPPPPPTFAQLVENGKLRTPRTPTAEELLADMPEIVARNEFRDACDDFARALGEACAADAASIKRLMVLADDARFEPLLLTAVAWTRTPEAVKSLCDKLPRLASAALADIDPRAPFEAACRGLVHADRTALPGAIAKMQSTECQDASWRVVGLDVAEPQFEAWLDAASSESARTAALRRIDAILRERGQTPATTSVGRMLSRLIVETVRGDGTTRAAAVGAAEALLGGGRGPHETGGSSNDSSGSRSRESKGEQMHPYPETETALRAWKSDLGAGRIAFVDRRSSAFDEASQPPTVLDPEVLSDVAPADDLRPAPAPDTAPATKFKPRVEFARPKFSGAKLHLRGAFTSEGLTLMLTNVGDAPISVDPVALRYVSAEVMDEKVSATGVESREYRRMSLLFGSTPHATVVDAKELVTLAPGKSFAWTTVVRPQDRGVDHVVVSLTYGIRVHGRPSAPLVTQFGDVWVK